MNTLDVAVLGLIFLLGVRGWFRGFFREFFGLAAWLGGGVGAHLLGPAFAPLASQRTGLPIALGQVIAFLGVFVVLYLACRLLGMLCARAADALFLRPLDRMGGLVFGAAKGVAIGALVCMIVTSRRGLPTMTEQVNESPVLTSLVERSWDLVVSLRGWAGLGPSWEPLPFSKFEDDARKALQRASGGEHRPSEGKR